METESADNLTVEVSNISPNATESDIIRFFGFCGTVLSSSFDRQEGSGQSYRGFLTFDKTGAVATALLLNRAIIQNQPIELSNSISLDSPAVPRAERVVQMEPIPNPNFDEDEREEIIREDNAGRKKTTSMIASFVASAQLMAADAAQKASEFDEKKGITRTLKSTGEDIKEKFNSSGVPQATSQASKSITDSTAGWRKVLSEKTSEIISSIPKENINKAVSSMSDTTKKAKESETAGKIVSVWNMWTKAAQEKIDEISAESQKIVEERKRNSAIASSPEMREEGQVPHEKM
ncbi:hypothetical protein PROFUN_14640 [Planoprotostelium fungivorum]|uniref:RRM domain-containing protein n=1 Tax=Planoprotostelium fungivorum TaxID=1890364 RepID=A0A2P6MZB8_9EUKA|nr:hypothetical protein PROFUN_14640 [Planoprotostelium fungivorum]